MKKIFTIGCLLATAVVFYNCHTTKKTTSATSPPKVTYDANIKPVIQANCTPCHIAGQGNKKPYDNFVNASADVDDILRRVQMNPDDRGFMPFKHPKLPDATIAILKQWKADGALEK